MTFSHAGMSIGGARWVSRQHQPQGGQREDRHAGPLVPAVDANLLIVGNPSRHRHAESEEDEQQYGCDPVKRSRERRIRHGTTLVDVAFCLHSLRWRRSIKWQRRNRVRCSTGRQKKTTGERTTRAVRTSVRTATSITGSRRIDTATTQRAVSRPPVGRGRKRSSDRLEQLRTPRHVDVGTDQGRGERRLGQADGNKPH